MDVCNSVQKALAAASYMTLKKNLFDLDTPMPGQLKISRVGFHQGDESEMSIKEACTEELN